ncbi:sulfur carrier protein ThiS [Ectothiorhodospiraceae bacterium BW-2]|nr:sulfur carrier protein ThiS [Ectothiorhodospiraceae bacterium BW-2]
MTFQLNGQPHQCEAETSLAALLQQLGLAEKRLAVELNGDVVPRSRFEQTLLKADAVVEIIHAIGGG